MEDLYGMFCRFLRFCPTIPGTAPTLEKAIEVGYTCLHHCGRGTTCMVCAFLGNLAYVLRSSGKYGRVLQMCVQMCVQMFGVVANAF